MGPSRDFDKSTLETVSEARNIYRVTLRSAHRYDPVKAIADIEAVKSIKALSENLHKNSQVSVMYSFDVLETIKGAKTTSVQLSLPIVLFEKPRSNLDDHSEESAFWSDKSVGRAEITPACLLTTYFDFGDVYLLVLPENYTKKSFERLSGINDPWLKYVRHHSEEKFLVE